MLKQLHKLTRGLGVWVFGPAFKEEQEKKRIAKYYHINCDIPN